MADDIAVDPGVGVGAVDVATDDIGGRNYQIGKLAYGADGSATMASSVFPYPVTLPGTSKDTLGRARQSTPEPLFNSTFAHDKVSVLWDESLTGTGTSAHGGADPWVAMAVSANSDAVIRQTIMRMPYQPEKTQAFTTTAILPNTASVVAKVGAFDGADGVFFENTNGTMRVGIMKAGSTTYVTRANWADPLDGTGPTGLTVDFSKITLFMIDYQWAGVVRFCIIQNSNMVLCHCVEHAGTASTVYMSTPNLPVRFEITSTGGTATLYQICAAVSSNGGTGANAIGRSADTGGSAITLSSAGTEYPILGLKLQSGRIEDRFDVTAISAMATSTGDNFRWRLLHAPTLSSGLSYSDVDNSVVQTAVGDGSITVTDSGNELAAGFVAADASTVSAIVRNMLTAGALIDGTPDEIVLAITGMNGSGDFSAAVGWKETV